MLGGKGGWTVTYYTQPTQLITKRYKTEIEMENDYQNIINMQNKLKKKSKDICTEILNEIENDNKNIIKIEK